MEKMQTAVRQFHDKFGCLINEKPTVIPENEARLRLKLIAEELYELADAMGFEAYFDIHEVHGWITLKIYDQEEPANLPKIADATGDIKYVTIGTDVAYGIDGESVFNEIHRSNMSKLWPDGKPHYREDGKVEKPDSYSPARVDAVLELQKNKRCGTCYIPSFEDGENEAYCDFGEDYAIGHNTHRYCSSCFKWEPSEQAIATMHEQCAKRERMSNNG